MVVDGVAAEEDAALKDRLVQRVPRARACRSSEAPSAAPTRAPTQREPRVRTCHFPPRRVFSTEFVCAIAPCRPH